MRPLDRKRPDPAPSRTAYRLQRLWLTPLFRGVLRTGLPLGAMLVAGGWYVSDAQRIETLRDAISETRASIEHRPEFMVNLMRIDNVSQEVADDIREITAIDFPISSFDLKLADLRQRIEELDAVASANLSIRTGGILDVAVVERLPAIIWRGRDELDLLDATGHRVSALSGRKARPDLFLIAGDGADVAVPEALRLFATAAPIIARVRGLLRVGERRWDVILDRQQRIMLPEIGAVSALDRVLALDEMDDLLNRDLSVVDMRIAKRPVLRLSGRANEIMHKTRLDLPGENNL